MNFENENEEKAYIILKKYVSMIVDTLNSIGADEKAILEKAFDLTQGGSRAHSVSSILSNVLASASMSIVPQNIRRTFLGVFMSMTYEKIEMMEKGESLQTQH